MNSDKDLDVIGFAETTVGNIVGAKNQTFVGDLKKPGHARSHGTIIVRADSV